MHRTVEITGNPKAIMHYVQNHKEIIQRYKIKLVGWIHLTFANSTKLSTSLPPLQKLLDGIKSGECKFVQLTPEQYKKEDDEYHEKLNNGEIILHEHMTRKDKGKKRKVRETSEDYSGSSVGEDDEDQSRKKSPGGPKSAATIHDSDSDE
jgi:hypothetical protein